MTEPVEAPVIEFGRSVMLSGYIAESGIEQADEMLRHDYKMQEALLDHLKVVHYVEPFHILESTEMDSLGRFQARGWYGRFAAPGYTAFQEHFKCRRSHFNNDPDFKYVWYIIKLWVKGKLSKEDEEDEDYDD